jgi:hypothetical membrane protein
MPPEIRKKVKSDEPVRSRMRLPDRRRAGLLLFAGSIGFGIGMTVAEAMFPGYNVAHDFLGDLGVGPSALVFNIAITSFGVALLTAAGLLARSFRDRFVGIALALAGIGAIGFGVVPATDAYPYRVIHTGAAFLAYAFGGLSAVLAFRVLRSPLRYVSAALGVVSLAALGLMISQTYVGLDRGTMEQIVVWSILVWGMAAGGALLIPPSPSSRESLPAGSRSA